MKGDAGTQEHERYVAGRTQEEKEAPVWEAKNSGAVVITWLSLQKVILK